MLRPNGALRPAHDSLYGHVSSSGFVLRAQAHGGFTCLSIMVFLPVSARQLRRYCCWAGYAQAQLLLSSHGENTIQGSNL